METSQQNRDSQENTEDRYVSFIEILKEAARIASGKNNKENKGTDIVRNNNKNTKGKQLVKWWDQECNTVIKNRKEKLKIWNRTQRIEDYIVFKRTRAIARKTIIKKKRKNLLDFAIV